MTFRVDPVVLRPTVPESFELRTVKGHAMAGLCLIRLEQMRPRGIPALTGLASDNAAYRVAVRWDSDGRHSPGVFLPRRDTSSSLQRRFGGRVFPGDYRQSVFDVRDERGVVAITCRSEDGQGDLRLVAREASSFPPGSAFGSLEEASAFFEEGAVGYSPASDGRRLDGLLLRTAGWSVRPLEVAYVESAFFSDPRRFPPGSVEFDDALIMRNVSHEWHALSGMGAEAGDQVESRRTDRRTSGASPR